MARIIQSQFPIDLTPSVAVGYGFPLNGDAVFVPTFTTREQTKANIINYLLTNKGERVFRPMFGGDLRNLLFENILESTQDDLLIMIQNDITRYFPTVVVKELKFENQEDRNEINFILTYQIENFGIEDLINIELQ
jgi:phage baseplate assembly protein W|tara:strand:+ start:4156 stop:4563 length:408 start_codon:yes stop_codon:yes gene_type:complete